VKNYERASLPNVLHLLHRGDHIPPRAIQHHLGPYRRRVGSQGEPIMHDGHPVWDSINGNSRAVLHFRVDTWLIKPPDLPLDDPRGQLAFNVTAAVGESALRLPPDELPEQVGWKVAYGKKWHPDQPLVLVAGIAGLQGWHYHRAMMRRVVALDAAPLVRLVATDAAIEHERPWMRRCLQTYTARCAPPASEHAPTSTHQLTRRRAHIAEHTKPSSWRAKHTTSLASSHLMHLMVAAMVAHCTHTPRRVRRPGVFFNDRQIYDGEGGLVLHYDLSSTTRGAWVVSNASFVGRSDGICFVSAPMGSGDLTRLDLTCLGVRRDRRCMMLLALATPMDHGIAHVSPPVDLPFFVL
jgi:hypothetical protein